MNEPLPQTVLNRLQTLTDQCVMCGLCLPHCPTYQRDRVEARGPRGRIALITAISASRDWLSATAAADLDSCLSCLRCEQACPAQVRYGELIDGARALWRPPGKMTRAWLWLVARPRLLAGLTAVGRRLRRVLPITPVLGLESAPVRDRRERVPEGSAVAQLLAGCSARSLEPSALAALLNLCERAGLRLQVIDSGCCGALHRHAGLPAAAQDLARAHWRRAHSDSQLPVLGWASGCQQQLRETAPARLATESVLVWSARELLPRMRFAPVVPGTLVGLWSPCTLSTQAQGQGTLECMLQAATGEQWRKLVAKGCCGAAGIRHLGADRSSQSLTDAVLDEAAEKGCSLLLSANPGCLHALRARAAQRKLALPVLHVYQWLLQRLQSQSSSISALPVLQD